MTPTQTIASFVLAGLIVVAVTVGLTVLIFLAAYFVALHKAAPVHRWEKAWHEVEEEINK
jgi:hypothetical protein